VKIGHGRDQAGGQADQAVEGRDQLGHRGHGDLAGDHRADAAADQRRRRRSCPMSHRIERALAPERQPGWCSTAMRHADHAVAGCRAWLVSGFDSPRSARMKRTPEMT
jgi:hypothetical protein